MLEAGGFGGRGHPSSPPRPTLTRPSLSSMLCPVASYRVHRTGIHLPPRGNPSSPCPLLKLTLHSFLLPPFLFPSGFLLSSFSRAPVCVRPRRDADVSTREPCACWCVFALFLRPRSTTAESRAERGRIEETDREREASNENEPSRRKHKLNPTRDSSGPP